MVTKVVNSIVTIQVVKFTVQGSRLSALRASS